MSSNSNSNSSNSNSNSSNSNRNSSNSNNTKSNSRNSNSSITSNLFINNNNNNNNSNNNNNNTININQYENINNNEYNEISKKMNKSTITIKPSNKKIYELLQLYNYNNNNINKTIESLSNENKLKINNLSKKNNILNIIKLLKIIKFLKKDKPSNKEFINKTQIDKIKNLNEKNKLKIIKLLKKDKLYKKNIKNRFTMFFNKENILNELSSNNRKLINELLKIGKKVKINKLEKLAYLEKMNKSRGFNQNNNINNIRQTLSNKNKVNISKITRMVNGVYKYLDFLQPDIKKIFKTKFEKLIRTNIKHIPNKSRKLEYESKKFILIPSIYDSSIPGNFKVNNKSLIGEGAFGKVYKNIHLINKNKERKLTYVFKIIKDKSSNTEFKSLIFNICLLAFLYFQNNFEIKYFCDLYEFGEIKNKGNSFYAIMENGGNELYDYKIPIDIHIITKLSNILIIIKECAKAIYVLHKIGIIHCDIKLENFLFKEQNGNYNIKIIDFGFCRKNGTVVDDLFGTQYYIPYDFFYSTQKDLEYKITVKNDIYALGIMFIELLFEIINMSAKNTVNNNLKQKIYNSNANTLNTLKNTINNIIDSNIKFIILNLNKDIYDINKKFIERLNIILRKITYLESNYNDLLRFIDDIDNLLKLLK